MEFQSQQAIRGTNAVKYPNDPKPSHTCRIRKVASKLSVSANHQGTAHCTMKSPRKVAEQQHIMGALALLCQVRGPAARFLNPGNPILGFIVISNISKYRKKYSTPHFPLWNFMLFPQNDFQFQHFFLLHREFLFSAWLSLWPFPSQGLYFQRLHCVQPFCPFPPLTPYDRLNCKRR